MSSVFLAWFQSARAKINKRPDDEEAAPLLDDDQQAENDPCPLNASSQSYGSADAPKSDGLGSGRSNADDMSSSKPEGQEEKTPRTPIHWFTYLRRFAIFIPYIWPTGKRRLQLHLVGIVICLVIIRFLNVLAPRQLGILINSFGASPGRLPVLELSSYVLFDWLTTSTVFGSIKDYLWLSVEQNAHRAIATTTFNHIMGLSCDFHDNKKSGELYMSMRQGSSIYSLFESVLFDLLPMFVDLIVACVYLSYLFGGYMAILVSTTTIIYLCSMSYLAAKQVVILRENTEASRKESQVLYDSMGCWTSVAYFNNFKHEQERYKTAVAANLEKQFKFHIIRYVARLLQDTILKVGFTAAAFLAAHQVSTGKIRIGDFVLLLDYWSRFTSGH